MKKKRRPLIFDSKERLTRLSQESRFRQENAIALKEVREEQLKLKAKRMRTGKPDPLTLVKQASGVIIYCRRRSNARP
jgi:hypothetical protein